MWNNQKIPEGWSVKKLKECLEIKHGKPQHDVEDKNGIYPILASGGEIGRTNSFLCNKPSVLIGRKGTIDKPQYMDTPFWTVDTLFYSLIKSEYLAKYIFYKFETINWNKYNEGSTIPSLSSSTIHSIKVLLPPLAEQEKIAEILGTWDEAIEKLSSLIEQKKLLKKGLMQKLLTGKVRLKGFTQPWKEVKLGELIKQKRIVIEKGKSLTSENIVEGAIPVIAGGKTSPYSHNKFTHNKPCITISASGAYAGYVWKHITPIWASDCNVLYGTDYDTNFLGCCLEYKQQQIYQLQTGGAQPHVYATDIKIITVPNINITEQQAIADVLSTADEEIDLLNKKLEALKEQKKCLMQQLLTGNIRVKVN